MIFETKMTYKICHLIFPLTLILITSEGWIKYPDQTLNLTIKPSEGLYPAEQSAM